MLIYLACFDIQDDKIRRKVGKELLKYGHRVQYSVFEVAFLKARQLDQLKPKLKAFLEPGDDLRFYFLPQIAREKSSTIDDQPIAQFPSAITL